MTAYVKTPVGNKLFTVEWNLEVASSSEVNGDPFEAKDCELISVFSLTNSGLQGFLVLSNHSDPLLYRFPVSIDDLVLSDMPGNIELPLPPVRYYYPLVAADMTSGDMRTSLMFREI